MVMNISRKVPLTWEQIKVAEELALELLNGVDVEVQYKIDLINEMLEYNLDLINLIIEERRKEND